jgi:hypothetical protein
VNGVQGRRAPSAQRKRQRRRDPGPRRLVEAGRWPTVVSRIAPRHRAHPERHSASSARARARGARSGTRHAEGARPEVGARYARQNQEPSSDPGSRHTRSNEDVQAGSNSELRARLDDGADVAPGACAIRPVGPLVDRGAAAVSGAYVRRRRRRAAVSSARSGTSRTFMSITSVSSHVGPRVGRRTRRSIAWSTSAPAACGRRGSRASLVRTAGELKQTLCAA